MSFSEFHRFGFLLEQKHRTWHCTNYRFIAPAKKKVLQTALFVRKKDNKVYFLFFDDLKYFLCRFPLLNNLFNADALFLLKGDDIIQFFLGLLDRLVVFLLKIGHRQVPGPEY